MISETDIIRTDEHLRVKEAIVQGPNGPEVVVLSIEDDKHTQEEIIKNEKMETVHLHGKAKTGEVAATDDHHHLEAGKSS
ncbi:hypothetical protein C2S53_011997 [Perilla frutescens var. hirtella]|uniref:Uncharacterized protein n=1 Tax=Perilla frutescens var. hirtella TaxID=608512 RepID=A0AAD4P2X1_PERFH|nr:hypothetical protein C2S51_007864 [Perilla frutescens var. frutescens]KAH6824112.1 hypothetical protein C2S53_011997 [Perilla frutescens var. hirtella]